MQKLTLGTLSTEKKPQTQTQNHQTHLDTTGGLFRAAEPSSTPEATLPLKAGHQANDIEKKRRLKCQTYHLLARPLNDNTVYNC